MVERIFIIAASADQYRIAGAEMIPDLYPGAGPVGGIVTGLTAAGPGCHLIVACDMPFIKAAVLNLLLEELHKAPSCDAVAPSIDGHTEPLCAAYRETALPRLSAFMESGRRSAREALQNLIIVRIEEARLRLLDPELETFTNINTPDDLVRLDLPNA